jgi:hypothetical protein
MNRIEISRIYKSKMNRFYIQKCNESSDINQHLPTLYRYAKECTHITECGVRGICSSYAFGHALEGRIGTSLIQIDPVSSPLQSEFSKLCGSCGIRNVFYEQSDLECPIEDTELLFIDTWHVYGQLKREFARWHSHVSKYIILHDTTVDEIRGESLRMGMDIQQQSKEFNMPIDEITKGLWPAVEEFLAEHTEWTLHERYTNNNGLTILKRL